MGIFVRWFAKWAVGAQKKELQSFVSALSAMDGQEVGFVLAIATHQRNQMETSGFRLMDPIIDYPMDPSVTFRLLRIIKEYQRAGQPSDAAGTMVWLHTMRVGAQHELRPLAREMWRQLERGMPHVMRAAAEIYALTHNFPDTTGSDRFPSGLTPDPI